MTVVAVEVGTALRVVGGSCSWSAAWNEGYVMARSGLRTAGGSCGVIVGVTGTLWVARTVHHNVDGSSDTNRTWVARAFLVRIDGHRNRIVDGRSAQSRSWSTGDHHSVDGSFAENCNENTPVAAARTDVRIVA